VRVPDSILRSSAAAIVIAGIGVPSGKQSDNGSMKSNCPPAIFTLAPQDVRRMPFKELFRKCIGDDTAHPCLRYLQPCHMAPEVAVNQFVLQNQA
jgi:hypothetical protein